jgi:hypothetical protein
MMSTLTRKLKNSGKKNFRRIFEVGQLFGVDLLPRHFYSEIPDVRALKRADRWKEPRSLFGVGGRDTNEQLAFVASCCSGAIVERLRRGGIYEQGCSENGEAGFGPVEADFLYAFMRTHQPARVVQVGCGVSTSVMLLAAAEAGYPLKLTCIDPYPSTYLREVDRRGLIELIPERAQDVPPELLTELGEGGLFFVDSSHVVGPGSEVNRIVFEVLPRLGRGTWVHFHDIFFPFDYQRGLMGDELFFNNESALLHAFLIGNERFAIRASLSMLHYEQREDLGRSLPNYRPARDDHGLAASSGHFPASTYLQVVG